jgi:hypothetical protein
MPTRYLQKTSFITYKLQLPVLRLYIQLFMYLSSQLKQAPGKQKLVLPNLLDDLFLWRIPERILHGKSLNHPLNYELWNT